MEPLALRLSALIVAALLIASSQSVQAQEPRHHKVEITGFKFVPASIDARPGDQIVFINNDVVPHTATRKPAGWDSGKLTMGQSWTLEIGLAGTHNYFCRFHPNMKAKIVVK